MRDVIILGASIADTEKLRRAIAKANLSIRLHTLNDCEAIADRIVIEGIDENLGMGMEMYTLDHSELFLFVAFNPLPYVYSSITGNYENHSKIWYRFLVPI